MISTFRTSDFQISGSAISSYKNIQEVPIKTIYDSKEKHQTHFKPIIDSIKIYKILATKFLKYTFASISSSIIDLILFSIFCYFLRGSASYIALSTIIARIISAIYNYTINYNIVFRSKGNIVASAIKYFILAVIQMGLSILFVSSFVKLFVSIPEVIIKIIVDAFLFFASYYIQQIYVFQKTSNNIK